MDAFIKKVDKSEKKDELITGDADDLRDAADEIKTTLGC